MKIEAASRLQKASSINDVDLSKLEITGDLKESFLRFLAMCKHLGDIGASRHVAIFVDGDGADKINCPGLEKYVKEIEGMPSEFDNILIQSGKAFRGFRME